VIMRAPTSNLQLPAPSQLSLGSVLHHIELPVCRCCSYSLCIHSLSDKQLSLLPPKYIISRVCTYQTSHRIDEPESSKKDHQQGLLPILCVLCVSLAHPCLTVHLAPTASQGTPSPWRISPHAPIPVHLFRRGSWAFKP